MALWGLACALAEVVHSGQTRRGNGEPYFEHLMRVSNSVHEGGAGIRAEIVAYLHDTIEDTTVTKHTLADIGFPTDIVHDVVMLTRSPDETYEHYIGRLIEFGSDDALKVKLADLYDNLSSLDDIDWDDLSKRDRLHERYTEAQAWIMAEQNGRDHSRETKLPAALSA